MTEYAALLVKYEPRVIHSAKEAARVQELIDHLTDQPELDDPHDALLELLGEILEAWEDSQEKIPDISGVDLAHALLAERGISQRDLVRAGVFATPSIASEVLSGRRRLNLTHLQKLAAFFNLSVDTFLPIQEANQAMAL